MKDTLRKKPKGAGSDSNAEFDVKSQSSESTSANPWATELSTAANGDSISRQTSKIPSSPDASSFTTSRTRSSTLEQSPAPLTAADQLTVPTENGDADSKPTRRRKTITKTPHTFELEVDLTPTKRPEPAAAPEAAPTSAPAPAAVQGPAGEAKPDVPVTPKKKKKRDSQPPPVDSSSPAVATAAAANVPSQAPTVAVTSPKDTEFAKASSSRRAATPASPPTMTSPAGNADSSRVQDPPRPSTNGAINPFVSHRPKKSLSTGSSVAGSNPCRFTPPGLPAESFHGKVVVLTNGASQVGQSLVRHFHSAGARVIFGDTNADQARKLISAIGPPHVIHFNKCDMTKYTDMVELFKLAVAMYGRVDHAIFSVADDGSQASTVAAAEKGWFEERSGFNKTAKMAYAEVDHEPSNDIGDILIAAPRFARIALAYLKYSPKAKAKKPSVMNPYSKPAVAPDASAPEHHDRSLTFVTSISGFKDTPHLPIYQVTQHAVLGLLRTLRTSVDPDPERDGVRINAVVSNIMVPRALAQSGGRMSVQLPPDRPEDIARAVVGVVAGTEGVWYEKGFERGVREKYLHGRVLYALGAECWDVQEGLDRSEGVWMGSKPAEALAQSMSGLGVGGGGQKGEAARESGWILDFT